MELRVAGSLCAAACLLNTSGAFAQSTFRASAEDVVFAPRGGQTATLCDDCGKTFTALAGPLDPGAPEGEDGATPSPASEAGIGRLTTGHAMGGASCLVDFSDPDALGLTEPSLWFDRLYIPWFQSCSNLGYADLRPTVAAHFHVGFADPDVEPCFSDPQAYPSIIDDEGNCDFVDVKTEPRTYASSHTSAEVFQLRTWKPSLSDWVTFDLDQIQVHSAGVELCYYKELSDPSEWEAAEPGGSPHAWFCWESLGPGTWDLSQWAWDVLEVTIAGAEGVASSVSFGDIVISP